MEQLQSRLFRVARTTRSPKRRRRSGDRRSVSDRTDLSRRGALRGLAASLPVLGAGGVPTASAAGDGSGADSGTLSNDSIAVAVDSSGIFQLTTAEGEQLTYPSAGTSGLTVRVDGTNYVATVDCPNCGQANLAGSAVCGACGRQLR